MLTVGWLSSAVLNTCDLRVGIVVLRVISVVMTPPSVSMPSESGVTSSSSTSLRSPARMLPWTAAPSATTSSGFTLRSGSLPKISFTIAWTAGIRVEPPTRITLSTCAGLSFASSSARTHGPRVRSIEVLDEPLELRALERELEVLRARSCPP